MPDIDDVGVRLRVDDDATAPLQRVREGAQTATAALKDMSSANPSLSALTGGLDALMAAMDRNTAASRELTVSLDRLASQADVAALSLRGAAAESGRLHSSLSSLGGVASTSLGFVGTAIKDATFGMAGLTAAVGFFGLRAASTFQQTQQAFSTLLGSQQAGASLFKDLQAMNLQTPFGLSDLTGATQTLLQYGIRGPQLEPLVQTLANTASLGGPNAKEDLQRQALALGQIASSGVIRGQDVNQLVQSAFPIMPLLQQVTGMSAQQVRAQMDSGGLQIPASALISAVAAGNGPVLGPLAQAAHAQSQTFGGQLSNLGDTVKTQLATAAGPTMDKLTQQLPMLTQEIGSFISTTGPVLFKLVDDIIVGLGHALPVLAPVVAQLGTSFHELLSDVGAHGKDLSSLLVDMAKLLPDLVRLLDDMIPIFDAVAKGLDGLLQFDGVQRMMGGLLVALVGFKALSGVAGIIGDIAKATRLLAVAEAEESVAGGVGGKGKGGILSGLGGLGSIGLSAIGSGLLGTIGGAAEIDALSRHAGDNLSTGQLLGNWGEAIAGGAAIGQARYGKAGAAWGAALGLLAATSKSAYDTYQDRHPDPSTVWDPTKPGYGGYVAPGSQDNRVQVNVQNMQVNSDADIQRALDEWQAAQVRRK